MDKVLDAIQPASQDRFIEIGPGSGALTVRLAPRVAHLTAVEIDRDLAARLQQAALPNTTVVVGDILEQQFTGLVAGGAVRVAGNLPYNIASPILFAMLDAVRHGLPILDATLMLQVEMADRLVAAVGTHEYGVLTILTALRADVRPVLALPPGAFRPMPRVRSALVRLTFRPPAVTLVDQVLFERLVRSIFTQRRKMLGNALRPLAEVMGIDPIGTLSAAGIDPRRRPETLQLTELALLADVLAVANERAVL